MDSISNHIIIIGWSERTNRIISQLRNAQNFTPDSMDPILVVTEDNVSTANLSFHRVYFINGNVHDLNTFRRANISSAKAVLIPLNHHQSSAPDGETILSLLTALAVTPEIKVCVELASENSAKVLELIKSNIKIAPNVEFVSFEAITEKLLAQVAINPGITKIYDHLLSFDESNEIYVMDIPKAWVGGTYRSLNFECFDKNVIVIGYENNEGLCLNPANRDYILRPSDKGWFIADSRHALEAVLNA